MRKLTLLFILSALFFSASLPAKDRTSLCAECQEMYELVDEAVGKSAFDSLNTRFHQLAIEHGDKNAELQYYLLQLRHLCRGSSKEQVLEAMENLKDKALKDGELKYYFNAYTRAAMYMTDIENDEKAVMSLIEKMLVDAQNYGSEYGFYEGNRYMASYTGRRETTSIPANMPWKPTEYTLKPKIRSYRKKPSSSGACLNCPKPTPPTTTPPDCFLMKPERSQPWP